MSTSPRRGIKYLWNLTVVSTLNHDLHRKLGTSQTTEQIKMIKTGVISLNSDKFHTEAVKMLNVNKEKISPI